MDLLEKKEFDVSRGFTYTYYVNGAKRNLPTLLMIHGFPDSPEEFSDVVRDYLLPHGYGVIAIDCLGYGGTSKPPEREAYNYQLLAQDMKDIIDHEGVDKVISTGHDWGSPLAQRFYNFHPDRVIGLVLLNAAYNAPSTTPFNLDALLQTTIKNFGYGTTWYWKLFTAPDGAAVLDAHLDSLWTLLHAAEPEIWLETLCKEGGIRNFAEQDRRVPVMPYATEERRLAWFERFASGRLDAPLNYYRAATFGTQDKAMAAIPRENYVVKVPHFFWGGTKDCVCRTEICDLSIKAGWTPDCTKVLVDSGHWAHLDRPKEFGEALLGWLKAKFPKTHL
ncbi:hypothetical protein RBB50_011841 [Rhinocladiella similis]